MFGRGKAQAMRTWGNVSAPLPIPWLQLDRNDLNREKNPRPIWRNFLDMYVNMQGGGLPTGNLYPTPLPNQTDPSTFIMGNARRLNPPYVIQSGGKSDFAATTTMQNAMGSGQAAVPPSAVVGPGFGNWGFEA